MNQKAPKFLIGDVVFDSSDEQLVEVIGATLFENNWQYHVKHKYSAADNRIITKAYVIGEEDLISINDLIDNYWKACKS